MSVTSIHECVCVCFNMCGIKTFNTLKIKTSFKRKTGRILNITQVRQIQAISKQEFQSLQKNQSTVKLTTHSACYRTQVLTLWKQLLRCACGVCVCVCNTCTSTQTAVEKNNMRDDAIAGLNVESEVKSRTCVNLCWKSFSFFSFVTFFFSS